MDYKVRALETGMTSLRPTSWLTSALSFFLLVTNKSDKSTLSATIVTTPTFPAELKMSLVLLFIARD